MQAHINALTYVTYKIKIKLSLENGKTTNSLGP